ncbi:TonB-dependent receptor [Candidatus Nitrospira salsa]
MRIHDGRLVLLIVSWLGLTGLPLPSAAEVSIVEEHKPNTEPPLTETLDTQDAANEVKPQASINQTVSPQRIKLKPVTVTATRFESPLSSIPGSVTVIPPETIKEQSLLTRNPSDLLGKLVPGLAPGNQSPTNNPIGSNGGQTLRGRTALVLIDGVPQTSIRNAGRDLRTIDPSAIDRIEVVRGATSIYGDGATGGIINIITKRPNSEIPTWTTDVMINSAPTNPSASFGGRFAQSLSGKKSGVDYLVSGSYEYVGGMFDADASRVPPDLLSAQGGLSDLSVYNIMGKFGYDFSQQRIQLTVNHFQSQQDTDYASDPTVNTLPLKSVRARSRKGLKLDDQPESRNTMVNLDYTHQNIFGSRVHSLAYYRNALTRFQPFDGQAIASLGNNITQSRVESEEIGFRLEINTPIPLPRVTSPRLLWGLDFSREEASQRVAIMDPTAFNNSNGLVFQKVDDRVWVPPLEQRNLGLFGQLEWSLLENWILQGGIRYERIDLNLESFTTLAGNTIAGGDLDFDATVFNAGTVVFLTDAVNVFFNYSQGFSIPDTGLILRSAPASFSFASSQLEPIEVDTYELGIRGEWHTFQTSLSGFYSESDFGVSSNGFAANVIRAPERVWGIEGTFDVQPDEAWALGGTLTWLEGENDVDRDDNYDALNGFRIPPVKLTGYIEHNTVPEWKWKNRIQILYVGNRNPGLNPMSFGGRPVESYTVLDLISTIQAGPGLLRFGIENLLNQDYFNTTAQLLRTGRNDSYTASRGMVVTLGYRVQY